ncbi:MAG TPA: DUF4231 domain-containing protein [Pyrinomonadaceae bacterium]|nr:DUF4231 domain-containing protein [Pyrinomonadaceae bacterium]
MTPPEYIEKRLQDQIDWYSRRSSTSQATFKTLRRMEIVAAALIPFLSGLAISDGRYRLALTIAIGVLGLVVTVIAGFLSLGRYQENWTDYRTTSESLRKEKFLFETRVEPYGGEDAFNLLVQRVETLISKENTNWGQYIMRPDQEKTDSKK